MHKFELTIAVLGSAKSFPGTVEAENIHTAALKAIESFKAENPGKDCKIVHIRMIDPPTSEKPAVDH